MISRRALPALLLVMLAPTVAYFATPSKHTRLVWGDMDAVLSPDSGDGTLIWLQRRHRVEDAHVPRPAFVAQFDPDSLGGWIPYARQFLSSQPSDNDTVSARVSRIATSLAGESLYFARRRVDGRWTSERFLAFRRRYNTSAQYFSLSSEQARVFLDSLASAALNTPVLTAEKLIENNYYRTHTPDTLECVRPDIGNARWLRYPEQARANNREGDVWASYLVTAAGRARENSLRVYFSDDALFSRAVREALPHFRFDAARKDGRPSELRVLQQFTFRLFRGGIPPSRDPVDERCY